jgi:hypothetical protein
VHELSPIPISVDPLLFSLSINSWEEVNIRTGNCTHEGLDDAIVCVVLRSEVLVAYHPAIYERRRRGRDDYCVLVAISIGLDRE